MTRTGFSVRDILELPGPKHNHGSVEEQQEEQEDSLCKWSFGAANLDMTSEDAFTFLTVKSNSFWKKKERFSCGLRLKARQEPQ